MLKNMTKEFEEKIKEKAISYGAVGVVWLLLIVLILVISFLIMTSLFVCNADWGRFVDFYGDIFGTETFWCSLTACSTSV